MDSNRCAGSSLDGHSIVLACSGRSMRIVRCASKAIPSCGGAVSLETLIQPEMDLSQACKLQRLDVICTPLIAML